MFITLSSNKWNIWQQFLDLEESDDKMMSLRGLRSCFALLKKVWKNFRAFWKTILLSVSSLLPLLGCDLHTEFHQLFTKLYLGLGPPVKPMVTMVAIKPPSSSISLDKSSSSVDHCAVIKSIMVVILLVKREMKLHLSYRRSCEQFGHWVRKRRRWCTLNKNDEV